MALNFYCHYFYYYWFCRSKSCGFSFHQPSSTKLGLRGSFVKCWLIPARLSDNLMCIVTCLLQSNSEFCTGSIEL